MSYSCEDVLVLTRLVRSLSADYDVRFRDLNLPPYCGCSRSQLAYLPLSNSSSSEEIVCTLPCLSLRRNRKIPGILTSRTEECSRLLARVSRFCKQTIRQAPQLLLRNLVHSFGQTLEVQLQRLLCSIMENQRKLGEEKGEINDLFEAFTTGSFTDRRSPVIPIAAWTSWSTILPEQISRDDTNDKVVMSILFEAEISVTIPNGKNETVRFGAPGTIAAVFRNGRNRPELIDITLNTQTLYNAMRNKSRNLARKVAIAVLGYDAVPKPKVSTDKQVQTQRESPGGVFMMNLNIKKDDPFSTNITDETTSIPESQETEDHVESTSIKKRWRISFPMLSNITKKSNVKRKVIE